jgi:hypothetical protein
MPRSERISRPALLACIACRKKHLRCDGRQPICSRCASAGSQCNFTPSRRGYKGSSSRQASLDPSATSASPAPFTPRRASNELAEARGWSLALPLAAPQSPSISNNRRGCTHASTSSNSYGYQESATGGMSPGNTDSFRTANDHQVMPPPDRQQHPLPSAQGIPSPSIDDEQLVNLFYDKFHSAHPILVPKGFYSKYHYPQYLRLVVQFIGSHYSQSFSSDSMKSQITTELAEKTFRTTSMVQAQLLFSIALYARDEAQEAHSVLGQAVDLALELGMNQQSFAFLHGRQLPVEEESLRRTWWELFMVEGYMNAFHQQSVFKTSRVESDVLLPCEESIFAEGACFSEPPSVAQFKGRFFTDDEIQFSSFCYRIEAMRILARVLALAGAQEVQQDEVQAVDNALAGWMYHLPPDKADIINTYGEVDEILFQAHMLIHYATAFLHFPRSNIFSNVPATAKIAYAQGDKRASPASTQHIHGIKATEASKQLSNLAALRLPVQNHTPFFVCSLVLSAVIQLSVCTVHACRCHEQHQDRITLIIGVLKAIGQNWTFSRMVVQQLKKVAAEVFQVGGTRSISTQHTSSHNNNIGSLGTVEDNSWFESLDVTGLQAMMRFGNEFNYNQPT